MCTRPLLVLCLPLAAMACSGAATDAPTDTDTDVPADTDQPADTDTEEPEDTDTEEPEDTEAPEDTGTSSLGALVINEFLASNDTRFADEEGEFEDLVELYNGTGATLDLTDHTLLNEDDVPFTFPPGTTMAPGAHLVVFADEDPEQGNLHADFKLSRESDFIRLSDGEGSVIDEIAWDGADTDAGLFGEQTTDVSVGRWPDGAGTWALLDPPTFGASNAP